MAIPYKFHDVFIFLISKYKSRVKRIEKKKTKEKSGNTEIVLYYISISKNGRTQSWRLRPEHDYSNYRNHYLQITTETLTY